MKSFIRIADFQFFRANAAAILSGVFLFSAISKIFYWHNTEHVIETLILNKEISIALTLSLIFIEFSIAVSLLFEPKLWKYIGIFIGLLIIVFTFIVFWGKYNNLLFKCPCFGNLFGAKIGFTLIIRNVLIFLFAVLLIFKNKSRKIVINDLLTIVISKMNMLLIVLNILVIGRFLGSVF